MVRIFIITHDQRHPSTIPKGTTAAGIAMCEGCLCPLQYGLSLSLAVMVHHHWVWWSHFDGRTWMNTGPKAKTETVERGVPAEPAAAAATAKVA